MEGQRREQDTASHFPAQEMCPVRGSCFARGRRALPCALGGFLIGTNFVYSIFYLMVCAERHLHLLWKL